LAKGTERALALTLSYEDHRDLPMRKRQVALPHVISGVSLGEVCSATLGVSMMAAPTAIMVEYALTTDAHQAETNADPAKIMVKLSDDTMLLKQSCAPRSKII